MFCTVHDMSPLCAGSLRKRALCPCAGGLFSDIFRVVRVTLTTTDQLGVPCRVRNHSNVMQTVDHLSIEHPVAHTGASLRDAHCRQYGFRLASWHPPRVAQ